MTTPAQIVNRVLGKVQPGQREVVNRLASTMDVNDTSASFDFDLDAIKPGAKLSIDLEDVHVWATKEPAKQASEVERAMYGSSAAEHAAGALVRVNARHSNHDIFVAVNEELDDLSSPALGLYRVKEVDLTYNASKRGYDLVGVTSLQSIIDVKWKSSAGDMNWPSVPRRSRELKRNMPVSDFPSGFGLFIHDSDVDPGAAVRVTYKAPYSQLTAAAWPAGNVEDLTGLSRSAVDIVVLGAAIRCSIGRELARAIFEQQPDARRAEEVPPGANAGGVGELARFRKQRIQAEAARLHRENPTVL